MTKKNDSGFEPVDQPYRQKDAEREEMWKSYLEMLTKEERIDGN